MNIPRRRKLPNEDKPRTVEYYMPDRDDPAAEGTLITPKFFATGDAAALGSSDLERRAALAGWLTSPKNPWFAKAFVNRVWAELVGEGFYEPVDDLGPDRKCNAPKTLNFLADQFIAHGYDVKWLYRTVAATEVYQRESRPRRGPQGANFAANCPQPLRSDQLFDAVLASLGVSEPALPPAAEWAPAALAERRSPRGIFREAFGFDPSLPREEVGLSIPQALMLMNAPRLQQAIDGRNPRTSLGELLRGEPDDEAVVVELYLRTLGRGPRDEEIAASLDYVHRQSSRIEAFEDLQWALLNSTEFLYRP